MTRLAQPPDVDVTGRLAVCGEEEHLRNCVLAVLLTEPGERVNLPPFGCGIRRLLFAGNSDMLQATARFLVTEGLERWLGDRIEVELVDVTSDPEDEERLLIEVAYTPVGGGRPDMVSVRL